MITLHYVGPAKGHAIAKLGHAATVCGQRAFGKNLKRITHTELLLGGPWHSASILAGGGAVTAENFNSPSVILSGVFVGVALRFVDNLTIEFAIFPAIMKIITKRGSQ